MMFLKLFLSVIILIFYLNSISSKGEKEFKGCIELEKLFIDICEEGGAKKDKMMSKAAKCYNEMLPEDADKVFL